jgi:DNA-binding response OmpR family regulator
MRIQKSFPVARKACYFSKRGNLSMSRKTNFPTVPLREVPQHLPSNGSNPYRPVVLVVDDESSIADTLAEILSRSGYASVCAYDGESGLETALLMPPEMLITDVILPGMSGIELAVTVKRVFPDCKILLFSGHASTGDLLASAKHQGHGFELLTKPVHPSNLLAHVAASLKPRKGQPQATAV